MNEPWNFSDLVTALRAAHDQIIAGVPVTWTGPATELIDVLEMAVGVPACFESLATATGRDSIDVLIRAALWLGIEQGRRESCRKARQIGDEPDPRFL